MTTMHITAEPGSQSVVITSEFDAPRDLVFRAYVDPELLVQWLGPRKLTMPVERNEARDGGTWRFVHRDAEGNESGFHGVFHGARPLTAPCGPSSTRAPRATSRWRR